jgi:uncharacterized protein (TIGR03118 family)
MKLLNKTTAALAIMLAGALTIPAQTNSYLNTVLVSNVANGSAVVDPKLVDPWGISFSAASPFWVSNHLSGTSTLYNGAGAINATVVTIPAGSATTAGTLGTPTGQVKPSTGFVIPAPNSKASSFIFATEDGTISAWNAGTVATIVVDNSAAKAVYKGLAVGTSAVGPTLYAANFRSGKIDVFDTNWSPATLAGTFSDPGVPAGYAPFNIWNLKNDLYVTYAKQDANKALDVAGAGNGYVSVFDQDGKLKKHLVEGGRLNSPWGVAIAPPVWGAFGGALLVGNFGDGRINAFDLTAGTPLGIVQDASGSPITIPGLWAIIFGNGGNGGDVKTLYYAAGVPNGSSVQRGLLGSIAPPAAIQAVVNAASQISRAVAPGEIVEIGGQTVGPSPGVAAPIPPAASGVAPALSGTSVTVNGTPAAILYTNGSQTNIQIPYEVAGSANANVVLKTGTQTTAAFTVPVAATSPGLFTLDFSGKGPAVALNADGTVNSSSNPALRGSMVWLFGTGEGVTTPASGDGMLQTDMSRMPVASVSVSFNGVTAKPTSATTVPRDVSGVLEVQATIPADATPGQVNVALSVGGISTDQAPDKQDVYIFVK